MKFPPAVFRVGLVIFVGMGITVFGMYKINRRLDLPLDGIYFDNRVCESFGGVQKEYCEKRITTSCDLLSGEMKNNCLWSEAVSTSNVSYCLSQRDEQKRDICLWEVYAMMSSPDSEVCELIRDVSIRESCLKYSGSAL